MNKKLERVISKSEFNHKTNELTLLQYNGVTVYDNNGINRISKNLKRAKEVGYSLRKYDKGFKYNKLYYIQIAQTIGLDNTIKALEEEMEFQLINSSESKKALKMLKNISKKVNK